MPKKMGSLDTNNPRNSASQVTPRRGTRQVHSSIDQHETADYNSPNGMDIDSADAGAETESVTMEASQDGTQGLTNNVQEKLGEMQANRRERDAARKLEVHKAYDADYAEAKAAINSYFDEREARASEDHDAMMARLKDLIEKKSKVETSMAQKLDALRSEYIRHSKMLEMVIEYRMKSLD